jgi:hypothetical protein
MSRVLLLVGESEIEVEAWLGEFAGTDGPQWGGVLRGVPEALARSLHHGHDARIRLLPERQERRIHCLPRSDTLDQAYAEVLFLGEGSSPTDLL